MVVSMIPIHQALILGNLTDFGFETRLDDVWAHVGRSDRSQGWKIHVSSVPVDLGDMLRSVLPVLRDMSATFKIVRSMDILLQLNEGALGPTQIGKVATIYPDSDEHAKKMLARLLPATAHLRGPAVVTDYKVGSVVYMRFGSFSPTLRADRLGREVFCLRDPSGNLVPDSYTLPQTPPDELL